MKKYVLVFFALSGILTYSQEKNDRDKEQEINDIIDDLLLDNNTLENLIDTSNNFQLLYMSIDYNSDSFFSGKDIGINQYNIKPQITYMHSKGFTGSISGIYYSEFTPKWNYTATTIGYGKDLDKKKRLRLHTSYSRYFFSKGVDNPFKNALSLSIGIKNKQQTIGTNLSGDYLFGSDESFQITSTSYGSFKLFKTKNSYVKLSPRFVIIAGKQTLELTQVYIQNRELVVAYLENDIFDVINTQINIPLQFNLNAFDFELGYNLNIPNPVGTESKLGTTRFLNLSIAYLIDL